MSLQEKFQICVPAKINAGEPWADLSTALIKKGNTSPGPGEKFNAMPIGYDATCARDDFRQGFGGDTDVSDGIDKKSLGSGYHRWDMKGTDDQYSGEHVDLFYGEALDEEGLEGFCERNNYLDRL